MGKRLQIKCENCGYDKVIMYGAGMKAKDPEAVSGMLKGLDKANWDWLVAQGILEKFVSGYTVGYCSSCNDLKNVYKVVCSIKADAEAGVEAEKGELVFGMDCADCGTKLAEADLKAEVKCPICQKGDMQYTVIGMWD